MTKPNLNLLITLDVLLTEGSVTRAAQKLQLSPSAMSRALAKLRETTGDPLLVRAGRGLVPTPRALELQTLVGQLVRDAETVLRPVKKLDLQNLSRTFTLRIRDGFVENFGPRLLSYVTEEAPNVKLRFVPKPNKDTTPLRDGSIDLDTGVIGPLTAPELRRHVLFRDQLVGVVRNGHPLSDDQVDIDRYLQGRHICVSRRGLNKGRVDQTLGPLNLERKVVTIVSNFSTALALARSSDLIATLPERHTRNLRAGMHSFELCPSPQPFTVSLFWHPRQDADLAHRWLRECVLRACTEKVV